MYRIEFLLMAVYLLVITIVVTFMIILFFRESEPEFEIDSCVIQEVADIEIEDGLIYVFGEDGNYCVFEAE